jgi:phosphoglycerol transferase MdoB-like AlkP superfamily enzyme
MFKQLGYTPRLFAGDSATGQHMQEIAAGQGFAEYYSAAAIVPGQLGRPRAHDAELFAYVAAHVPPQQRSINVIRTTSNHGPYDLNLDTEGCRIERLPDELAPLCNRDLATLLCHWGHLKYSDKCLGRFVDEMAARFPDAVFVITGDHHGRNFIHTRPTDYEATSVPLILYGPRALAGVTLPPGVAGSHLDIAPTLVALVAPAGFRFASLGNDLLEPRRRFLGISETHAIGPDFIINFARAPTVEPLPWATTDLAALRAAARDLPRIVRTHQALEDLSTGLDRPAREASLHDFAPTVRR